MGASVIELHWLVWGPCTPVQVVQNLYGIYKNYRFSEKCQFAPKLSMMEYLNAMYHIHLTYF